MGILPELPKISLSGLPFSPGIFRSRKFLFILAIFFALFLILASGVFVFKSFVLKYKLGLGELLRVVTGKANLPKLVAEKEYPWQPTQLMSYPVRDKTGRERYRIFVILGKLERKEGRVWQVRPAGGEELRVKITKRTKFYQRIPFLTKDQFRWGEKSEPAKESIFRQGDVVMVEWRLSGLPKKEKDLINKDGRLKKEFWQIEALSLSKRV